MRLQVKNINPEYVISMSNTPIHMYINPENPSTYAISITMCEVSKNCIKLPNTILNIVCCLIERGHVAHRIKIYDIATNTYYLYSEFMIEHASNYSLPLEGLHQYVKDMNEI